jgi:acyl-CoA synthetase (AMP-forming)/AMP-acid ligase II
MNIAQWLYRQSAQLPHGPAVAQGFALRYTYCQLAHAAHRGAQALARLGCQPGDRVGLYKTNHASCGRYGL